MGLANRNILIRLAALAALALVGVTADAASRVNVGLNQSLHLGVRGVAANVVVSNTAIADVTMVDTHSVIVIGKGYGATQIMVLDHNGRVLLDSVVTVTAPEGQMTLYRGGASQQYNCTPRCEQDSTKASSGGGSAASSAPPGA
jgi:Flp pilus assembly secretin CpaC